ncbi:MAG: hypothetical protein IH901_06590 [Proteobacteria bacterium]|nr:hypothetical protein [Pseudomonadota bacterium]
MFKYWLSVDDYPQILSKCGNYLFLEVYLGSLILRKTINPVEGLFSRFEASIQLGEIEVILATINGSGLLIGFIAMVLGHILQFHKRLSNLIGIRKYFDLYIILLPLGSLSGSKASILTLEKLNVNRLAIMGQVFYKFCSVTAKNSPVDKHLIQNALTAWSWFWVLLEGLAIWLIFLLISVFFFESHIASKWFLAIIIFYLLPLRLIFQRCISYATAEVNSIIDNKKAKEHVKKKFNEL